MIGEFTPLQFFVLAMMLALMMAVSSMGDE